MSDNQAPKQTIPVMFWKAERTIHIPIAHMLPLEAALARWVGKPLICSRPRRRFVQLHRRNRL